MITDISKLNTQTEAQRSGFDATTPPRTIETITSEIRAFQRGALVYAIEIGRRLVEAKELLSHGEWGRWLSEEVDFSQSTANNFMKLFAEYGSPQTTLFGAELNSQTFGNLSYSKALKLLALPSGEREEFAAEHDIDSMSTRELDKLIAEREAEKQRADKLAAEKEELGVKYATLESDYILSEENGKKALDEASRLREELDELKARPVDVAVEAADPAEIDRAVEEATKEREEEIKALEKKLVEAEKAASMSDPVTTEFKLIFGEVQQKLGRLLELAAAAGENSGKLSAALEKMLERFAEEVKA